MNQSYKSSGVDVEAGYRAVELMKESVRSTFTKGVIGDIGGFGGLFAPDFSGMARPVLVSGTDGVGTKIMLAIQADKHDTIGIDCVAMCANDVACSGAAPLFFLDYIICETVVPERIASIVKGIAEGCRQAGAALLGGETAEHPGCFPENEYDLAGFCVGLADYGKRIDGGSIRPGDVLIGLPSSGVHSNGFSLIRKIYPHPCPEHLEALLTPTTIYVRAVRELREKVTVKGLAHITGGGWIENIPRMLPEGCRAVMDMSALEAPEIFQKIAADGAVPREDMYNTFNMGMGICACVPPEDAEKSGYPVVGRVEEGKKGVKLW